MKEALVIVDMQNEFYDMDRSVFDNKIIPNLKKALEIYRAGKKEVIHVITKYAEDKSNWPETRKNDKTLWCMDGTEAAQIVKGFEPLSDEKTVIKTRFSSFYNTNLDSILQRSHIDKVVLAGYASDVCIRMTAVDAYNNGYYVCLLKDAMHSFYEEYERSLEYLKWLIKAEIR